MANREAMVQVMVRVLEALLLAVTARPVVMVVMRRLLTPTLLLQPLVVLTLLTLVIMATRLTQVTVMVTTLPTLATMVRLRLQLTQLMLMGLSPRLL
jgi:hypothetical protein